MRECCYHFKLMMHIGSKIYTNNLYTIIGALGEGPPEGCGVWSTPIRNSWEVPQHTGYGTQSEGRV